MNLKINKQSFNIDSSKNFFINPNDTVEIDIPKGTSFWPQLNTNEKDIDIKLGNNYSIDSDIKLKYMAELLQDDSNLTSLIFNIYNKKIVKIRNLKEFVNTFKNTQFYDI